MQEMTTFQKVILALSVVLVGILTSSSGWLILSVIEIDRTQEVVLQRLASLEGARLECNQRVQNLHDKIDSQTSDRFTGREGRDMKKYIQDEIAESDAKNGIQHTFIWAELNELEEKVMKIHDAIFQ